MKVYRSEKAKEAILRTYDELLNQWGIPVEELMVPTTYGQTHVITAGKEDGQPVFMFHGVGDDAALMWVYNAKALSEHFKIYAVDTIGGPGKSQIGEKYDKDFDDIKWIDEVLQYFNLDKVSIMGVSHGGYLVQHYALCRLEKVQKAISLAAAVPAGSQGNPMKTMLKIFLPEALFPTKKNVIRLLKKLSGKHAEVFIENELILEHYTYLLKGFNNMAMGNHKVRSFTKEEIDRIRDKVIYLVGEEDPFEKLGGANALKENRMNVRFFRDAGHGINHEISEIINQELISILSE